MSRPGTLLRLLAAMVIWGSVGLFVRHIALPGDVVALARGLAGSAFVAAAMLALHRHPQRIPTGILLRLAFSGAALGLNWALLFTAFDYTSVAAATLANYMAPVIVMVLSPAVLGERISRLKAACIALCVLGMALVSGHELAGTQNATGILLALLSALAYAAVVLASKKAGQVDAMASTAVQLAAAGLVMVPCTACTGHLSLEAVPLSSMAWLAAVCILHTGLAYVLYFGALPGLSAQTVAVCSYLDPLVAVLVSAFVLGEPLGLAGWIGAVLILAASVAAETLGRR